MNQFSKTLVVLVALVSTRFAQTVYGGVPTSPAISKSIVNIKFFNGMCSGVVLKPNVILTAAHCEDRFGHPEVVAYIQSDSPTRQCDIKNVVHSEYEPSAEPILPLKVHAPDILLLKLEGELCSVVPAVLQDRSLQPGDRILQAGHGGGTKDFGQPYQVELEMIQSDLISDLVHPRDKIERDLLRESPKAYFFALPTKLKSSVCHGDSGGPSFIESEGTMKLFGVNGAVLPNEELGSKCSKAYLHMISPVEPYLDWIQSRLNEWTQEELAEIKKN